MYSSGLDDRVQHVANRMILTKDGCLNRTNFSLLLSNTFLQVGQLALQRLHDFFSDLLLFSELLRAGNRFLAPVLELFAHAVNVVGHEVDRLAEWKCALAQNLDGFLHELNIVLVETSSSGIGGLGVHNLFGVGLWLGFA